MRYFIGRQGQQLGPFTDAQVRDQLARGAISADDLIWHEGLPAWQPVGSLFRPGAVPPPIAPTFPSMITREVIDEGPALAGRGRRLAATGIDHVCAYLCMLPGLIKIFPLLTDVLVKAAETNQEPDPELVLRLMIDSFTITLLPLLVLGIVQMALLSARGQTIGKILCKIRVVRTSGERAGFVHAFLLRTVVMGLVTGIPVVGGFIALADPLFIFREDRRCIHDLLAGTT